MLAAREVPVPTMFRKNWHISAYTILSGTVLALELMHGQPDAASRQRLRSEVQAFITLLRSSDSNAMIRRGIVLLDKMLAVADSAAKRGSNGGEVGSGLAVDIAVGGGGEIESEMSMASWAASVPLTLDSDFLNILLNNDPWVSTSWMTE
jgi:hypothetical protein